MQRHAIALTDHLRPAGKSQGQGGGDEDRGTVPPLDHLVQFYEDDEALAATVAKFLDDGLRAGDSLVVVATAEHWQLFRHRLEALGADVDSLFASRRLTLLDAHETLSTFMRNGEPERELFERSVGRLVSELAGNVAPGGCLRAYGEMVDVLWRKGQRSAALRLEQLWNELQGREAFTLLCAYAVGSFYKEPADLQHVCAAHSHVQRSDASARGGDATATPLPPQHARLAREIAHRKEVETALRVCVGELSAHRDALLEREQQLHLIADALPVLVSFIDARVTYRFVSAAYERWFGHTRSEIEGKRAEDVLGADAYELVRPHMERALSGEVVTFEAEVPYRDGGTRSVEATYLPQRAPDGTVSGFVALVADITERKALERTRLQAAARAEKLLRITAAIADAVSASQVFEAVVDHVADAVNASSAGLWLVDEHGGQIRLARSQGYHEAARQQLAVLPLDLTPSIPVLDSIRRGDPLFIPSPASLLELYPHLAQVRTPGRSYRIACLPLIAHARVLGALGLTIEEEGHADDEEREFLLLVARYASQAVERLRLLEAERQSRAAATAAAERLGVLSRASRTFADSELDLEPRLHSVAAELATALGSCINIALLRSDGHLHLTAVRHPILEAQELLDTLTPTAPIRSGEGLTGSIAATGQSVILTDLSPARVTERAAPAYRAFLQRFPVFALIGAPLRVRGRTIGTVTATRVREGETYTNEDLRLLEELAERAAIAIENGRLYEESVGARSRAEQLYRFAQAVVGADRIEAVYEAALASIAVALGTSRVAILTFDPDGVMRFKASHGLSGEYRAAVEGHSPWTPDAVAPQPVLVPDPTMDPAMETYLPLFRREGIGALAFIPLVAGGRLLGKFMVYYDRPHPFTPQEVDTASAVANHLASVIVRFTAVAKLEETIQHNELFAGVLAHDLRNPLAAMMTAAQLVLMRREGSNPAADREERPLGRILSSGQRMTTMIDQLLDFTRARSGGGIQVQPHATDLADLCSQAVGELELTHPDWTVSREIFGDQRGTWDSDRLLQVLSNLVSNAGHHGTRKEGIVVKLDGTDRDQVKVEVHNRGTIPEPLLPLLFDPFRTTQHRRDQSRGLGLGLFIVREIVRGHGGTVEVSSSEAAGTTFTLRLPRHSARRRADDATKPGL